MKSKFKNVVLVATVTFLVACGGGGNGASNAPLRPAPTPPPESGVVGDGRLDELAEWARASYGVPALAVVLVMNGLIDENPGKRCRHALSQGTKMPFVIHRNSDGFRCGAITDRRNFGNLSVRYKHNRPSDRPVQKATPMVST